MARPGLRDTRVVQTKVGIRWENTPSVGVPTRIGTSREKRPRAALAPKPAQQLTRQQLQARLVWASLIKRVYEALC